MSAATVIFIATKFLMCYPISMTGTGNASLFIIIFAACIIIFKNDSDRSAGCFTIENATFKNGIIIFLSWCGAFLLVRLFFFPDQAINLLLLMINLRGTINNNTYRFAMRFTKDGNTEYAAKTIHE